MEKKRTSVQCLSLIHIFYLIMVAQFQSLLSPFIVMFTIPLAFTGGFLGLLLTGQDLSIIAMIGFIMLSGIIVNNGIVLVDYINQLRREGTEKKEAIIEAGKTRMRPIMMTALTTILAMCTMALGVGDGAEMTQPMAIVTIGGLKMCIRDRCWWGERSWPRCPAGSTEKFSGVSTAGSPRKKFVDDLIGALHLHVAGRQHEVTVQGVPHPHDARPVARLQQAAAIGLALCLLYTSRCV